MKVRRFVRLAAVELDMEPSGRRLTVEAMDPVAEAFTRHRQPVAYGRTCLQSHRGPPATPPVAIARADQVNVANQQVVAGKVDGA
ncbi:MAG TPA: hypothetical protein VGM69_12900 [Chloroflexota bacterium]